MKSNFSLRCVFVVVAIVAAILTLFALRRQGEVARTRQVAARKLQIIAGLLYQHGAFPTHGPSNEPGDSKSWRFNLAAGYDRTLYDSPPRLEELDNNLHGLFCLFPDSGVPRLERFTHVMAIFGPGTVHDEVNESSGLNFGNIDPDVVILSEVCNSSTHWMEAGDLHVGRMPHEVNPSTQVGIGGNVGNGFHVAFADGAVWFLRRDILFDRLEKFFTIDGASKADRNVELLPYLIEELPANPHRNSLQKESDKSP